MMRSDPSKLESLRPTMEKSLVTLLVISLEVPYVQCRSFADPVPLKAPNLIQVVGIISFFNIGPSKDPSKDWRSQNTLDPFALESAKGTSHSLQESRFSPGQRSSLSIGTERGSHSMPLVFETSQPRTRWNQ